MRKAILSLCISGLIGLSLIAYAKPLEDQKIMKISVDANGKRTVFKLNNSPAALGLYEQLPLKSEVKNFGKNEKIFYPPKKLNTAGTPLVSTAISGTLAYYAPWGNIVMFYGKFGSAAGLYELGKAISGSEHIQDMSGLLQISKE